MRATLRNLGWVIGLSGAAAAASGAAAASERRHPIDRLPLALAGQERAREPDAASLLPSLAQQAQAQFRDGELAEVVALRRRALAIAARAYGSASSKTGEAMTALARAYIDRRRYLDAEPLLIAAQNLFADRPGAEPGGLASVLAARARVAVARGEPQAAAPWAERAVAIVAKDRQPGSTEPWRALAAVRAGEERFEDAERLLGDALARDRAGGQALPLARTLAQLGNLYLRQKRFAEALPALAEAAALDQEALAPSHPLIADDFADLGLAYEGLHRLDAARAALDFAIKLLRQGSEKHTPRLAYAELELVRILRAQGNTAAADTAYREARAILNQAEDEERERERRI